nr:MAG TPA: hypothetical protein [Caudoviricetes sp.]
MILSISDHPSYWVSPTARTRLYNHSQISIMESLSTYLHGYTLIYITHLNIL